MKKKRFLLLIISMLILKVSAQDLVMAEVNISAENSSYSSHNLNSYTKANETIRFEFIEFDYTEEIEALNKSQLTNNFFGENAARKEKLFTDLYTYQVPVGPGSPATKTVIRKPAIYMATKKLYKYYKKEVKSNSLSIKNASLEYENILNIALSTIHQQSEEFEDKLGDAKTPEELSDVFKVVALVQ
jgi:hypothetical protein